MTQLPLPALSMVTKISNIKIRGRINMNQINEELHVTFKVNLNHCWDPSETGRREQIIIFINEWRYLSFS